MKSLLFVIPTMRMGGAERSLVSLLSSLEPTHVQVDLLLFEAGGVLQSELPDWVHVYEADAVTRGMILEFRYYGKTLLKENLSAFISRLWMTARSALERARQQAGEPLESEETRGKDESGEDLELAKAKFEFFKI